MKRPITEVYEFLTIIVILGLVSLFLEYFKIGINRIYVIIAVLIIWLVGKQFLRNRNKNR